MNLRNRLARIAAFVFLLTAVVSAEPVAQLKPAGYVNDFAHVLAPNTAAQMEDICRQIDQNAHAQIAVVTINSLDGSDPESYAVDLFSKWGIGSKATNRGVLILYVIQDRKARIEVGYGLEPILPDGKVGGFQREAVPLMRGGDYSGAISLVTARVASVIAQDAGIQLSNVPRLPAARPGHDQGQVRLSPLSILGIIVVIVIILCTPLRNVVFWLLLSQVFDDRGRGGGFGGFGGGGGSGGGFGGFGGGSSGGGGASSSW
ncbi:MAG TPA: TPM domain-containing protein [Candidatus Angelobacter sp.]|nr:TPM domain-containing protein [Candidatus Angelobacter sp.]